MNARGKPWNTKHLLIDLTSVLRRRVELTSTKLPYSMERIFSAQ